MSWKLSHFRAGDVVEIRSKEEILATLDESGCVDGLPFMPEMLQFCGQRVAVRAVAHKTCETALKTYQGRRLASAVHLDNLRCDGAAHGGCEADCPLFWKDVWLRPVKEFATHADPETKVSGAPRCSEEQLFARTQATRTEDGKQRYACQATKLYDATEPIVWWDVRQYLYDVVTGNHSLGHVVRITWLATLRGTVRAVAGIKYLRGAVWRFSQWMHRLLLGREMPTLFTSVQPLQTTPSGRLDLKAGEWIRIKPKSEIEKTLDKRARNRGLSFDPAEMAPYCGGTYRVRRIVKKLIDEETGELKDMREPCIILEGVVCKGELSTCRLNCPRELYPYWRELWLERTSRAEG
jgi:hypothetical protein